MGKNTPIQKGSFQLKALAITILLSMLVVGALYFSGGSNPLSEPHNQVSWPFSKSTAAIGTAEDQHTNLFAAAAVLFIFCLMLFLPFWPGLRESLWPRDEYPLPIEMEYSKDPRHLGKSFRTILRQSLGTDTTTPDIRTVQLSKEEVIEIRLSCRIKTGETVPYTLMVQEDMHTEHHVTIDHDLYVIGSAYIGKKNKIRTLACDGNINLESDSRLMRWMDAVGKIDVGSGCDLGVSCSTVKCLSLDHEVVFRRLFGSPIITPGYTERPLPPMTAVADATVPIKKIKTIEDITYYRRKSALLQSGTVINQNVIVKGNLDIADHVTIYGDVRCEGHITVGKESTICGDLFSEGPVEIFQDAVVMGNLFSQDAVHLFPGSRIGRSGSTKSVIAKKKITLEQNIAIHGYVLTEGQGLVL